MIDQYGRNISYLRVSVTDRCNLKCFYCRPKCNFSAINHEEILTYEELHRLIRISASLGVKKVRITGGEPLVRKGIVDFIPKITSIPGIDDVSLTTNGVYLKENLEKIYEGGIHRINISLDTLQQDRYHQITGVDCFHKVWEAIELAGKMKFHPVKINMVVIDGFNDDEVVEMAALSRWYPFHVRFIEFMPIGEYGRNKEFRMIPLSRIKKRLEGVGKLVPIERNGIDGPAERYAFEGAMGEIGFISSISNHFCASCNRLRLTSSGFLRPCLLTNTQEDIKCPMRRGVSDDELAHIMMRAVAKKPKEHKLTRQSNEFVSGQMHMIGG